MINFRLPLLNFPHRLKPQMTRRISFFLSRPSGLFTNLRELTQRRRTGNENGKKALAKQQLGTCITFYLLLLLLLFISLPSLHDHDMKLAGLLLKRGTRRAGNGKTKNGNKTSWTLALSVTSFPILCFVPIFSYSHFFIFPFPVLVTSHETVLISRFLEDVTSPILSFSFCYPYACLMLF